MNSRSGKTKEDEIRILFDKMKERTGRCDIPVITKKDESIVLRYSERELITNDMFKSFCGFCKKNT
jgi:hypothetical protein